MIQKKLDSAQNALKNKDFKKAKKLFEEAISINPKLPAVHNILGNIELNFGNLKESVKFFQKAIELKPNFSGALCNLGLAFKRLKNEKLAINNYLKAINVEFICMSHGNHQGGRSWRASGDHQISLTVLAQSACLQIFATKTSYFTIANFWNINVVFFLQFCIQNLYFFMKTGIFRVLVAENS